MRHKLICLTTHQVSETRASSLDSSSGACGTRARSLDGLSRECARGMNERRTDLTGENYQIYNQLPKYMLSTDVNDRRKVDRAVRGRMYCGYVAGELVTRYMTT